METGVTDLTGLGEDEFVEGYQGCSEEDRVIYDEELNRRIEKAEDGMDDLKRRRERDLRSTGHQSLAKAINQSYYPKISEVSEKLKLYKSLQEK